MFTTGLVSISFRKETPQTLIRASREAGLEKIEWGGDVHVPVGDLARAKQVGEETRARWAGSVRLWQLFPHWDFSAG